VVNEGGAFYLFGGTEGAARQSDVHAYNVETNLWQEIRSSGVSSPARSGAQTVVYDNCVWFFGGYTKKDGDYFNDVYKYDIGMSSWSMVSTLGEAPSKRTDHSVVLFGRSMFVFGGFDGHNRFNDLRELTLDRERRWSNITSRSGHPRSRFGHTAVVYQNSMFVFGGWDGHDTLQELCEYNFPSNMWCHLPPRGSPPRGRYRHTAVVCGDSMFTFGGVDKTQYRFPDLHEFDLVRRLWSKVSTTSVPPTARTFHKTNVHEGYMYILGGFDGRRLNDMHRILLRTPQELARRGSARPAVDDAGAGQKPNGAQTMAGTANARAASDMGPVGDAQDQSSALMPEDLWTWQKVTDQYGKMYTPRTGHAVVVWNNCFYLMGGSDEKSLQNDIYQFNVHLKRWDLIDPVTGTAPSARSGSKAVVCRDSIFFFGGYTKKDGDYFNDLYEFDIPRAHWTLIQTSITPIVRTDHSCVVHNHCLYIFGGFDGRSRFQDLHQYNIEEQKWTEIQSSDNTPMARFGHTACMYKASMFIFGGWNGHDVLDDLYEFSMTTCQWYSVPGRGDVPPSRYRHSGVVYGCCMFVFGGVDKRQARFADLCEFNFDTRSWSRVKTYGDPPSPRTFHRTVIYGGCMYILGGFDGTRRNDMYVIPLLEQFPREEKLRRKKIASQGHADGEAAPDEGPEDPDLAEIQGTESEASLLRLKVLELQKRLEMELERHLCKICYEREINTVILDCNHRTVCSRCLDQVATCPMCRAPISKVVQTYNA
jgi:N-acetylneuraminic acid mutarotase